MTFCIEACKRVSECVCISASVFKLLLLSASHEASSVKTFSSGLYVTIVLRLGDKLPKHASDLCHELPKALDWQHRWRMGCTDASSHPAISASKCPQFTMRGWTHLSLWHDLQSLQLLQCLSFQHLPSPSPEMTRWRGTKLRGNCFRNAWSQLPRLLTVSIKSPYMNIRQN